MVRAAWLWRRKSSKDREFKFRLCYPTTRKLCQPSSKWVTFSNQGKIRQRKEQDRLRLSFAMPMMQWDSNPTAPTAIRLWETFTLTLGRACLELFLLLVVSLVPSVSLWEEARCRQSY